MSDPTYPVMTDRDALPEPLRLLLNEYPREAWEGHPHFRGLVTFWLERHMMFRQLLARLAQDGEEILDRQMEGQAYALRLARYGQMLLEHLHGHHRIEDQQYFPLLVQAEPRLERGFDMLERDHQALDPALSVFADKANAVLTVAEDEDAAREAVPAVMQEVSGLERLLDRHLTDEEDLVVPVILHSGLQ